MQTPDVFEYSQICPSWHYLSWNGIKIEIEAWKPSLFATRNSSDRYKYIYHDFALPLAIVDGHMNVSKNGINQHLTPFSAFLEMTIHRVRTRTHARDIHIFNCYTICYLSIFVNSLTHTYNAIRIFMIPTTSTAMMTTTTQRQTENDAWKIFWFARANAFLFLTITLY